MRVWLTLNYLLRVAARGVSGAGQSLTDLDAGECLISTDLGQGEDGAHAYLTRQPPTGYMDMNTGGED